MTTRPGSKVKARVWSVDGASKRLRTDEIATEEPLEIRLLAGGETKTVAVTMRTPGADFELAAGFLFSEGVIGHRDEISTIAYCVDVEAEQQYNIVNVSLRADTIPDLPSLDRHFFTSSACGVCGKAGLETLQIRGCPVIPAGPIFDPKLIVDLPRQLEANQRLFTLTGGLHAAALFDETGTMLVCREDVGRHNAVDKLVGWALMANKLPLNRYAIMVSGRASYEIMQKCLVAGVPMVCAVSAPSSLSVEVAQEFGMSLVGFLRGERFNIYAGRERIAGMVA
ncbi:MAG: formate dehydrogenase accessory sulfurtransferase FdhD [Caldilineaceae bacterium]|nr:formate dehydrogenase accessory sulfurtransferase FdhD [Caldilineaceae bacterium]MBP8106624.1 formate dehydrogenase accessory sulfurtransferase FdhD [Caldilineaceae bacterium]MBP8121331.1 formate dehydrogenase accessory sulfurtransferase FdhD [Caldilineaceae bacterium]MBP9070897.1 formate dehydrogenase accessory sulfurtransferase FdhD [Caldilineaceae bacterium]